MLLQNEQNTLKSLDKVVLDNALTKLKTFGKKWLALTAKYAFNPEVVKYK